MTFEEWWDETYGIDGEPAPRGTLTYYIAKNAWLQGSQEGYRKALEDGTHIGKSES